MSDSKAPEFAELASHLIQLCASDPDKGLELLKTFTAKSQGVAGEPLFKLARAIAYSSKGRSPLIARSIRVWSAPSSSVRDLISDGNLSRLEEALKLTREIEQQSPETAQMIQEDWLDETCVVVERCKPGRVQQILGRTKLRYFGQGRLHLMPACQNEELAPYLGVFLSTDKIVRSALVLQVGNEQSRSYAYVALYEEMDSSTDDQIADLVYLFNDGGFRRGSSKPDGPQKEKGKGFLKRLFG